MALELLRRSSALQMRRRAFRLLIPATSRLVRFLLRDSLSRFCLSSTNWQSACAATAALPLLVHPKGLGHLFHRVPQAAKEKPKPFSFCSSPSQCSSRGAATVIMTACSKLPCCQRFCKLPVVPFIPIPPTRRTRHPPSWWSLKKIFEDHPADAGFVRCCEKLQCCNRNDCPPNLEHQPKQPRAVIILVIKYSIDYSPN